MSERRVALSRQNLAKLLGELRTMSVVEAQFHRDGRLAAVRFAAGDPAGAEEPEAPGNILKPQPDRWAAQREAFHVLHGKSDEGFGEP